MDTTGTRRALSGDDAVAMRDTGVERGAVVRPTGAITEYTVAVELDPAATALLVVDMQYASACRTTGFGRWLLEHGRADEGRYRFDRIEQLLIPNISRLLTFFRENDLPRVFVRLGAQMAGCRDLIPHIRDLEMAFGNMQGQREFEILDELEPRSNEPVVTKLSASAFTSSNIDALLRNLGVRTVIFTGVSTSQCVDLSARDAADRGYGCVIVEDAVAEDTPNYHAWTLEQFQRLFGRVMATDDVVTELAAAIAAKASEAEA